MRPGESTATIGAATSAVLKPDMAGLVPFDRIRRRWPLWIGALVSFAMVAGLARQLFDDGLTGLTRIAPASPLFYLAFLITYFAAPAFDYLIYRRLWSLPAHGLGPLLRKRIANDVVLGYTGDAYFYAWARARLKMVAAPFGAVKDVALLSAMAGNAVALVLIAIGLPLAAGLLTRHQFAIATGSAAIILTISLAVLLFSKRVFSLRPGRLWWVFAMHCARVLIGAAALVAAWHFALLAVPIGLWAILATFRILVSRLPLVPNKDLLFANFAIILMGQGRALSDLIAFSAGLTLLLHLMLMIAFGLLAIMGRFK